MPEWREFHKTLLPAVGGSDFELYAKKLSSGFKLHFLSQLQKASRPLIYQNGGFIFSKKFDSQKTSEARPLTASGLTGHFKKIHYYLK